MQSSLVKSSGLTAVKGEKTKPRNLQWCNSPRRAPRKITEWVLGISLNAHYDLISNKVLYATFVSAVQIITHGLFIHAVHTMFSNNYCVVG